MSPYLLCTNRCRDHAVCILQHRPIDDVRQPTLQDSHRFLLRVPASGPTFDEGFGVGVVPGLSQSDSVDRSVDLTVAPQELVFVIDRSTMDLRDT